MTDEADADTAAAQVGATPAPGDGQQTTSQQTTTTTTAPASDFALPDEYKEKSWAAKVKTQDDLYKQLDNLSTLVGKKVIQPIDYEKASAEEIAAHYKKLAPEDVESYKFSDKSDPTFAKAIAPIFQEFGITPHQAAGLEAKITEIASSMVEAQRAEDTSEEGYFKLMEASFGDKAKGVAGFVETNLRQYASDEDKAIFDGVDNATRTAIDRTIFRILQAHGVKESGAQVEGGAGKPGSANIDDTRKDLRQKIADLGKRPHTAEEKQKLVDQLSATYKQ